MDDLREKVIKGLECCAVKNITPESARHCGICPYDRERNGEMDFDCQNDLLCDALELLKAQEPIAPKLIKMYPHDIYECGNCKHRSVGSKDYKAKYCPECGQAVKWDK